MKISCTQENLNKGLFVVSHISGKNASLPILSNILIKTENGLIVLSTTNLEIGINCYVRGKVEQEGSIVIDSKVLTDYVSLLPKEKIDCEIVDQNQLQITCNNYKTKIKGNIADDFPIIPVIDRENKISTKAIDFKKSVQKAIFAAKYDESRPELSGILLNFNKDLSKINLVATDAYRLAEQSMNFLGNIEKDIEVILPIKTMQELIRIINDENFDLDIYISDGQVLFVYDNFELVSKIIEGQYPDYKQIIPNSFITKTKINKNDLIKAIKSSSIFSKTGLMDVELKFSATDDKNGKVSISSSNAIVGENSVELDIELIGQNNDITLNYKYLLDGLSNMEGDLVNFACIDNNNPCIVKSEADSSYLYLVMPIRQ